ncbi:SAM-dependent methyltransferase [Variovorax sp. WS11]|uniref:class I SAM-dependent methyltransferase n=1 Tax=Variovorax sp. WS11 TaxID=1105204 RepID=UPI000D0CFB52|nr:class I SAM-dependent methyltransferase [Variovorax sp. WS11]NDZ12338.1 class I SAM-dependent methyltransferase [Variovorax sp. WS11]PSL85404.1 SAM-dependent methyltransferase [Variovorax sp. WS11]
MTGFSADWLALREPHDLAARAESAATLNLRGMATRMRRDGQALDVLDLACGTGANLRALAPRLGGAQRWLLVDHDPRLLAALPGIFAAWSSAQGLVLRAEAESLRVEGPDWNADVRWRCADLASALEAVPFADAQLVTAAALLDLVSASWLDALFERLQKAKAAAFFALSVDGRVSWDPVVEEDEAVHRLFAAHQRRDKGFGPALGGEAPAMAAARLAAMGYGVSQSRSDWHIEDMAMLQAMIDGMGSAALEQEPNAHALIQAWRTRRSASLPYGRLQVGHVDLLALR